MEKYGSAINAIFATKKRISFISMLFKKQSDTLSALDLAIKVCEDFHKAEEKTTIQVLIGQVVSIEESQRKTIEAVQQTIDAIKTRK